jgi:hypothetical protein
MEPAMNYRKKTSKSRARARHSVVDVALTGSIAAQESAFIGGFLRFSFGPKPRETAGNLINKEKNLSLLHTCSHMPVPARVRAYGGQRHSRRFSSSQHHHLLKETDMTESCRDCRYFHPGEYLAMTVTDELGRRVVTGECRRQGPVDPPREPGGLRDLAEWPVVMAINWCGLYQQKSPEQSTPSSGFPKEARR